MKNAKHIVLILLAFVMLTSCGREIKKEEVTKTEFSSRVEEIRAIREYLDKRLPEYAELKQQEYVQSRYDYNLSQGLDVSREDCARETFIYHMTFDFIMATVVKNKLSFEEAKISIDSFVIGADEEFGIKNVKKTKYKNRDYTNSSEQYETNYNEETVNDNEKSQVDNVLNSVKNENDVSVEDNADGIGNNFEARKIIYRSSPKYICSEQGKVVVSILVDREGKCIEANAGVKGTTNYAICLLDEAKVAAMNTRWNADSSAPDKQVGQIIYNFNLN